MDVHLKRDLSVAYQVTQISSPSSKGCHCHPLEQTKLRLAMEPPGAALQVSRHHYRLWHDLMPCRAQDPDPTCFTPSETTAAFHPLHTSLQLAERMGFTPWHTGIQISLQHKPVFPLALSLLTASRDPAELPALQGTMLSAGAGPSATPTSSSSVTTLIQHENPCILQRNPHSNN